MFMRRLVLIASCVALAAMPLRAEALDLFKKDTMEIPKGATATIKGNTARIKQSRPGGPGVVVTVACTCEGGSGTCSVSVTGENVECFKGNNATCTGSCKITGSTTTGLGVFIH